jgi:hypothetical protein
MNDVLDDTDYIWYGVNDNVVRQVFVCANNDCEEAGCLSYIHPTFYQKTDERYVPPWCGACHFELEYVTTQVLLKEEN